MKNSAIDLSIAVLGLGEAGSRFANDLTDLGLKVYGWDPALKRVLDPRIVFSKSNLEAARDADIIFNVNLSKVAEDVAREILPVLRPEQVFLEMNTAAPSLKIAVFEILKPSGVQFVDLGIMAPVPPAGIRTPFLACGPGADLFFQKMGKLGLNIEILPGEVGDAAARKLLRSIIYKGIAAVICESVESGRAFGLEDYVREQIRSVIGDDDTQIDRFLTGSQTHAERRMHEMEAVVAMLEEKNMQPFMSRAAVENLKKIKSSSTQ
ncbi:MAG: NAD(P)-binding domain-containing protein [Bacteroidota bacterium]